MFVFLWLRDSCMDLCASLKGNGAWKWEGAEYLNRGSLMEVLNQRAGKTLLEPFK